MRRTPQLKLPNFQQAHIEPEKITGYLLSDSHDRGRGKAVFFSRFGFSVDSPQEIEIALLDHCSQHQAVEVGQTPYGVKYTVDGALETPDGRNPLIRTVWQVDVGKDYPRFITAYPLD